MKRALPAILACALAIASGASAQEAIPTAANLADGGAPAVTDSGPINITHKREPDDRGPVRVGPCGAVSVSTDGTMPPPPDKNPHGAVWAGVGTHGYRNVGGVVCVPLGNNSAVTVAVDSTRWGRR